MQVIAVTSSKGQNGFNNGLQLLIVFLPINNWYRSEQSVL